MYEILCILWGKALADSPLTFLPLLHPTKLSGGKSLGLLQFEAHMFPHSLIAISFHIALVFIFIY